MKEIRTRWRGRLAYREALEEQRAHRHAVATGGAEEEIWLLEHDRVVTIGRRPPEDLDRERLARMGLEVVPTERGGLATWHGPGQLVAYTLVHVQARGFGPRSFVCAVETTLIDWLGRLGVEAGRRRGLPGIWVGVDKIAAIGLHIQDGVAMHGLALNLNPELRDFTFFTPCGVLDGGVTSLARVLGWTPAIEEAAQSLGSALATSLRRGPSAAEACARPAGPPILPNDIDGAFGPE